jgi:hypothetical protein
MNPLADCAMAALRTSTDDGRWLRPDISAAVVKEFRVQGMQMPPQRSWSEVHHGGAHDERRLALAQGEARQEHTHTICLYASSLDLAGWVVWQVCTRAQARNVRCLSSVSVGEALAKGRCSVLCTAERGCGARPRQVATRCAFLCSDGLCLHLKPNPNLKTLNPKP